MGACLRQQALVNIPGVGGWDQTSSGQVPLFEHFASQKRLQKGSFCYSRLSGPIKANMETEYEGCIFICSGLQIKMPEMERLKQQKFTSHRSGGWQVKVRVPAVCLVICRWPPSCGIFLHMPRQVISLVTLLSRALIPFFRVPPLCPNYLPIPSHCGLSGLQHMNCGWEA